MEQIRSFIAIELPEEIRVGLAHLQDSLRLGEQNFVKQVDPQGIHLTLKFLGNIAIDSVPEITGVVAEAVQGISPFSLEIGGLGLFPNSRQARVAWVGVRGDVDKVVRVQKRIDSALAPLGFPVESRSFTPHLTLARLRERASPRERQSFGELVMSAKFEAAYALEVNFISLMRSKLTPTGAIYSCITSVRLENALSISST